jgi:hypothetical protein
MILMAFYLVVNNNLRPAAISARILKKNNQLRIPFHFSG